MSELVCQKCGYHKTVGNEYKNMMEVPVYPMYDPSIVAPFLAMEYSQSELDGYCPGCGKNGCWKYIE